ncbi:MAG: ATP synthase subunit I [Candidatus Sedimenticola sp. (ex Thyasira tokunagai)]
MRLTDKNQAIRAVAAQFGVTLATTLLLLLFFGWTEAYSGFTGGTIAVLGSAWFSRRVFVHYKAQDPGRLLARFYTAELEKLVVTAVLFAGTVIWINPLSAAALFGVFLLVQFVPMLAARFVF